MHHEYVSSENTHKISVFVFGGRRLRNTLWTIRLLTSIGTLFCWTAFVDADAPRITTITVHPTTTAHEQVLDFDIQLDPDRPYISGSTSLAPTVFNAAHKVNSNSTVNQARVMPLMVTEERIGFAAQGTDGRQALTFANWQYIDKFVSWGGTAERNVTAPGQAWIDAAHRNGVKIFGNVFLAPTAFGGFQEQLDYLVQQNGNGDFIVADKLIELAETQGFDGWFLNQETNTNIATATKVAELMDYWQAKSNVELIWYDSMTESGAVSWQDQLNANNDRFFQHNGNVVSESMFLDFTPTVSELASSKVLANSLGRSEFDLYAGANLESNGIDQGDFAMNRFLTSGAGGSHHASVGMFRPDNEYFNDYAASGFDFQAMIASEAKTYVGAAGDPSNTSTLVPGTTWNGMAHHLAAKTPLTRDRFVSNFNYGIGTDYFINGEVLSTKDWNNMGAQDVLPTWRWIVDTTDATPLSVQFDFSEAFIGGSSLNVSGSLDEDSDLPLYLSEIPVFSDSKLAFVYKPDSTGPTSMQAFITLKGNEATRIPLSIGNSASVDWNEVELDLSTYAGQTISSIGLRFLDNDDANYDISIGQIGVIRGARDIPATTTNLRFQEDPVQLGAADQFEARLLWDHSADHASAFETNNVYYYNVYQQFADDSRELLGVTGGEGFYINDLWQEQGISIGRIVVEAVSLEFGVSETQFLFDWSDFTTVLSADFNDDGEIDKDDYVIMMQNMFASPLGSLPGDLTGDDFVDVDDHVAFCNLYEGINGVGSFASLFAVPEPGSLLIVTFAGNLCLVYRFRRL